MIHFLPMNIFARIWDGLIGTFDPVKAVGRRQARNVLNRSVFTGTNDKAFWRISAQGGTADQATKRTNGEYRAKARLALEGMPSAIAVVDSLVSLVCSTGSNIEPNTGNDDQDAKLKYVWNTWFEEMDASGVLDGQGMLRQLFREDCSVGGCLWQIVPCDGKILPFGIKAISIEQLSDEPVKKIPKKNFFSQGVEKDKNGKPLFYHIVPETEDEFGISDNKLNGERIQADKIIHYYDKTRPSQSVGSSVLFKMLSTIAQETELVEVELESAKIASAMAMAITSESGEAGLGFSEETGDLSKDDVGNPITKVKSGTVVNLSAGDDIKILESTRPSPMISPFRDMLRGDIAGIAGLSKTDIDKDYGRANFSSMRAEQLDKKRRFTPVQKYLLKKTLSELYIRLFPVICAVADVDMATDRVMLKKQQKHTLHTAGWEYINPKEDVTTAVLAIENGLSTYQEEFGKRGKDWEEHHAQAVSEQNTTLVKLLAEKKEKQNDKTKTK